MEQNTWVQQLATKEDLWYSSEKSIYGPLLHQLYGRLRNLASRGELYGFFLQLRDFFEAMIRWYDLTGIALAAYHQDTDTVSMLCDPQHAFSFGDWVQIPSAKLRHSAFIRDTSLEKLLGLLVKQYNKNKIVFWRNESIGHGALQPDTSHEFLCELEEKLVDLKQCLTLLAPLAKNIVYQRNLSNVFCCSVDSSPFFPLAPFIQETSGDYRMFDSLQRGTETGRVLNYQTGKRSTVAMPKLHQISIHYYGTVPVTAKGIFNDTAFSGKLESALQRFHSTDQYYKQVHYFQWLNECLDGYDCGVFLLDADSGTGKSVFTDQLDGHGGQALLKHGFVCRTYHFSRISFRASSEFSFALGDLFRSVPEFEDELHGKLPVLTNQLPPEQRSASMLEFLRAFRDLYQRTYSQDKLLFVMDGIDQLAPEDTHLLNFVPDPAVFPKGIYILITCSSENLSGTFQQDFLESFSFTKTVHFSRNEENAHLLKQAIAQSMTLSGKTLDPAQIDQIAQIIDLRFTALPVVQTLLKYH